LAEEVFDFSKNTVTSVKATELKEQLKGEFKAVYDLCIFVLNNYEANPQ
jgi:exportin-1